MKKIVCIFIISFISALAYSQINNVDLYGSFLNKKPKYKEAFIKEIRFDRQGPYDTVLISQEQWTKNKHKITTFDWSGLGVGFGGCSENSSVRVYDSLKRNTLIVRYYCSEELRGEILISKYPDSTVSLDMKTNACSTKIYDKKNNSWTVKAADGKKYVTYEDPVKSIDLEFHNDSLIWKLIRYQKRNRVDSTCMFNYEKNESSKEIYKYNKHGDIVYSETREYTRGDTKITKVTTSFIYDKKGNWIKKRVHNDSFPKTDLISKSAYLRTLIY